MLSVRSVFRTTLKVTRVLELVRRFPFECSIYARATPGMTIRDAGYVDY